MEKKLTPRDLKSNEKKKRIYKAAMSLFKKYGYAQVTMKMIAAESGMSEGSIFHYYGEKAGILDYVIHVQEELNPILAEARECSADAKETVCKYLCKELEVYEELGRDLTSVVIHRVSANMIPPNGELHEIMKVIQPALTDYIKENMECGHLYSRYTPYEVAYIITSQGAGLAGIWCNFGENYSLVENGKRAFEILIDSVFD